MVMIFTLSGQTRTASSQLSTGITAQIVDFVASVTNMPPQEKAAAVLSLHHIVRKCAHFTIYALLGLSSSVMFASFCRGKKKRRIILYAVLFCCIYAATDELHQNFVNGRGPQVTDVMIDTAGAFFGSMIFLVGYRIWRRIAND